MCIRIVCAGFFALILAFLALLWPGWPLHPLTSLASWRAQKQGITLQVQSPWLHLRTDLALDLDVKGIRLGDQANPDALALNTLAVRWRLVDLLHARWTPETVRLDEAAATLVADTTGRPQFLSLPSTPPATAPAPAFTPADLPANLLPAAGGTLTLSIARTRLALPANLPVAKVATGPVALTVSQLRTGYLDLGGSLDLKVDDRPGSVEFAGQLALVRDWLGKFDGRLTAAPGPAAAATRVAFSVSRTDAAKPAALSLHINDCTPGDWLALLGRSDLPQLTGRFDADIEASGDPIRRHIDATSVRIETGAFVVTQPSLLVRPLAITPLTIALKIEDNGNRGALAPFSTRAGPLALDCSGVTWQSAGATVSGNGGLQLGAVPLTSLLEWLPPALREKIPLTAEEAAEIGLAATTVTLDASGERTAAPPRLHVTARTGLTLNQELVAIEAESRFDPATRQIDLHLALPDFVQARWNLALLRRFPVPELAAPLRAEFDLTGHWPATLDEARWRVVAGEGHVVPKGPSLRWLARPFPITSFALAGSLASGQKKLAIDQLDFVSGRAHLAFERTELQSPQALITTSGQAPASVLFTLKLEHWYAADFIPLLGPELRSMVAPAADDLAQIGLEKLETGAEINFARLPWIDPAITALNGKQSAVFRLGEARLPVDAVWKFDPVTRRIASTVHLEGLRPDRLTLPSLKTAPVLPDVLDLAFAADLDVSANPYAQSLDRMDLKADIRVRAEGGRIKANPFLAADLPVKHLSLAASARILPLRLDRLKAEADFDGPTLLIDDARLDLGEAGRGGLRLALREFPLDWALARVPPSWKPALLKDAQVRGRLAKLDLTAEFPSPTPSAPAPLPTALTLSANLSDLDLGLPGKPALTLPQLALSGNLDRLDVRIDRASTDGVSLANFTAAITTPLTAARRADAAGTVDADLARLPALLAAAKPWVTLPPSIDLTGLAGHATVVFTAASPLDPAKLSTDLKAKATVTASQLVLPMVPTSMRIGPSTLTLTADVTGQSATGSLGWQPTSLTVAPWITGAPTVNATYTATPQAVDFHPQVDLASTVINVPQLYWRKPVGLPATLTADARLTLPVAAAPGHLAATIATTGLIASPLGTRAEADLSDDQHPALNLLSGISSLQLRDTQVGLSSFELDATRAADGATRLALRSPKVDLAEWISRFSSIISAWNKAQVPPPAAPATTVAAVKPAPAPVPPPPAAIPVLDLPAIDLQADIARVSLTPTSQLTGVTLAATLRDGLPASLAFSASAGASTGLTVHLAPAAGRHPWSCTLTDLGGWLRTAATPLSLLTDGPLPPGSPLETLGSLHSTFVSGNIAMQGTADLRDLKNTVDGSFHIDGLALEEELKFLSKIAALVKKRVILHVPFKVFDVPAFTASPTFVSFKKMRVEGPLTITSEYLNLDLVNRQIDMAGKVLGIGFDVAGPISDPSFYLSDKNLLIKAVGQTNDFDF